MALINEMFQNMDIEQDQKVELSEAFDKAVLKETTRLLDEHVEQIVTEKVELIEEEYKEKVSLLEDSLDGYLDTVVEEFIQENAPQYEAQIDEEKTKTLLGLFDQMIEVAGVDMLTIKESKEDQDAEALEETAVYRVQELEDKVTEMADKLVESKREADKFLKTGLVKEISEGLTILETAKFEKLAEMVQFDRDESYIDKLEQIKETILSSRSQEYVGDPALAELPQQAFKKDARVDKVAAMDYSKYL